jgi:hypothetical protein
MVDREQLFGMSLDEIVMARVGQIVGALCFLFILPVLPFVLAAGAVSRLGREESHTVEYGTD